MKFVRNQRRRDVIESDEDDDMEVQDEDDGKQITPFVLADVIAPLDDEPLSEEGKT